VQSIPEYLLVLVGDDLECAGLTALWFADESGVEPPHSKIARFAGSGRQMIPATVRQALPHCAAAKPRSLLF